MTLLVACGQKGALTLGKPATAATPAVSAPVSAALPASTPR
jgi:hypothetical protein